MIPYPIYVQLDTNLLELDMGNFYSCGIMFVVPIYTLPFKSMWSLMRHQFANKKFM